MTTLTSSDTNILESNGRLNKLKAALSSTNEHVCSHGHPHSHNEDEEKEIKDIWAKSDQIGEYIAAITGLLVLSPWIDRFIRLFNNQIPLSSQNTPLKLSYMSIIASMPFIYLSMNGAGYCHNKMNILPRLKKNLLANVLKELSRDVESTTFHSAYATVMIDNTEITLNPHLFEAIPSSKAPSLSSHDYRKLFGDWLAHFVEYVGLWLVAINFYVENKNLNLGLSLLCTALAGIASLPEWWTCKNILLESNAVKSYRIIDATDQQSHPALDYLNAFAALAKSMPVLLASALNFKQISGNRGVGIGLGVLTTASHIGYQYVINDNSKIIGQTHDEATLQDFKKATLAKKTTLLGYGSSIASERAEPFLFVIFAFFALSEKEKSAISAAFLLLLMLTVPAAVRNALTHWNTFTRRKGIATNYNSAGFLGCCASKKSMSKQEGLLTPLVEEEHKHSCGGHDHNHDHNHGHSHK